MRQEPVAVANMLNAKGKVKKNLSGSGSEKDPKEICDRCGKTHSGKCRYVTSTCNGCGKQGHLEAVCRSKEKTKDETLKSQNEIVCTMRTLIC